VLYSCKQKSSLKIWFFLYLFGAHIGQLLISVLCQLSVLVAVTLSLLLHVNIQRHWGVSERSEFSESSYCNITYCSELMTWYRFCLQLCLPLAFWLPSEDTNRGWRHYGSGGVVRYLQTSQASSRSERRKKITVKIYEASFTSHVEIYVLRLGKI
jgi:hypothetical protein